MLAEKGSSLLNKPICQNLCTKALYTPGGNLQNLVRPIRSQTTGATAR